MSNRTPHGPQPSPRKLQRPRMRRFDFGPAANDAAPDTPGRAPR